MEQDSGGRGWLAVFALTLAAAAFSVVPPVLLIFVPLGLLLLGEGVRRPGLAILGAALTAALFLGQPGGRLWYTQRGWVLVLAAWFVIACAAVPAWRFLSRAVAAVAASVATAAAFFAVRGGWGAFDGAMAQQFRQGAAQVAAAWRTAKAGSWAEELGKAASRAAEFQAVVYPALLAIGSVAALAVAWWGYRRLAQRDAMPLGRLREFRFRDELVWLVIAGLLLWLLPIGAPTQRVGQNVLVFMGALYVLRGTAVLITMIGGIGPLGALMAGLVLVLLYPFVMGAALVVGLSDTWVDYRTRRRQADGLS